MTQNAINNTASILAVDNLTLDGNTLSSTDTDGDIVLAPDGTGTVSVTLAPIVPTGDRTDSLGSATNSWDNVYCDGVSFDDGTAILADYVREGTWTPGVSFGGGTTGITYGTQIGNYIRLGVFMFATAQIILTSKGSSTGNALITGLPITSRNAINSYNSAISVNLTLTTTPAFLNVVGNSTTANVFSNGSTTILTDVAFADNTNLFFTLTYQAT